MSVSDRWHKSKLGPDEVPCKEHSRGNTKLYPTSEHLRGDRWLVRWRSESGEQLKRSFPKKSGRDPETCAEACEAQRHADEARGEWMDSRLHKTGTVETYELHLKTQIMPVFGSYGLAANRPTMLQQWIKDLQSV